MSNDPRPTSSSASLPGARALPLRDVRDLALAVVEGAVAAESLAKELRRTPDRSRHFQEIAERLRAIVGRPSIRTALTEQTVTVELGPSPSRPEPPPPVRAGTPPQLRTVEVAAPPPAAPARGRDQPRTSGELDVATLDGTERLEGLERLGRIEAALRDLDVEDAFATLRDALESRLTTIDERLSRLGAIEERLSRLAVIEERLSRRDQGERYALRSPEEAIALAARLTERLRREPRVVVRIELAE